MGNLQNTVRRLIIILPSLFFLVIIRASIWSPYGKNLAEPRYDQKDDQFAKYCHTPLNLRFHLVFRCLLSNRHFGSLTLKFLLSPITKETMTNFQNTAKRLGTVVFRKCFDANHQSEIFSSYCEIRTESQFGPKYDQFSKHCHRPFIHRFAMVFLCVLCKQHFGVLTVKFLLNQITTHKMASLENIVTRLRIIVLCSCYSAYHQNDTLELLPWNCHLTPLWRKRWPICKILSHASKSSLSFSYLVLIVWATLWSC